MRTQQKGRMRVMHFSNPGVNYDGESTGVTDESFNSRILNQNGWVLQDFRYSTPALLVNIQGPGSANNGDPLTFYPTVYNGENPYSYTWQANIGSGFYTAGYSSTLDMTMPTDNNLEITLAVTDGNNQQASDYAFVQNNFFGGGCTICPDSTLNESIDIENQIIRNPGLRQINVYPNPSSDELTILYNDDFSSDAKFLIVDNRGLLISELEVHITEKELNSKTLDISGLRRGVYFLKYSDGNSFKTVRFIKK